MPEVLFVIAWCAVAAFILFSIFTRKGRKKAITVMFPGSTILADYGELDAASIRFGSQKLHAYGLEDSEGRFIAIENRQAMPLSYQITWLRLDAQSIDELKAHADALLQQKAPSE